MEEHDGAGMRAPDQECRILTQVTQWENGEVRDLQDSLAAEEPLEIRIGDVPLTVTMRTPGTIPNWRRDFFYGRNH